MFKQGTLPQALFFHGPAGVGKSLIGRHLLQSLFCSGEIKPCNSCKECIQFKSRTLPDLIIITPNEKGKIAIGKDVADEGTIRWLIGKLGKKSNTGTYGILIEGVDSITIEGQNALLKTIEEPPPGTHIILTAESRASVLPTILSRSLEIQFNNLAAEDCRYIIEDKFQIDNGEDIAKVSGGSIKTASYLVDEAILKEVIIVCKAIYTIKAKKSTDEISIVALGKLTNNNDAIQILISIFSNVLRIKIQEKEIPAIVSFLEDLSIEDLQSIVKILLTLKNYQTNNINLNLGLKGLLYSEDKPRTGLPDLFN